MILTNATESLRTLTSRLPFALDEVEQANEAFRRWRVQGDDEALQEVQLWTYCFVRRYYLMKFARRRSARIADFDMLVDRTFRKVVDQHGGIEQPDRYASWVSVVCKHTYINYLNRGPDHHSLDAAREEGRQGPATHTPVYDDAGALYRALQQAIGRLPSYLREVAQLRFVEHEGYPEIAGATGLKLPTVRTYVHRALKQLRRDDRLRTVFEVCPRSQDAG